MPASRSAGPLLLLAAMSLPSPAASTTYYVSPTGDDDADGTSPGEAWRTLQHAADEVGAGDTVIALRGRHAGFNLFTSGSAGAPITFTANPGVPAPNPAVIIDRSNGFTDRDRVNLEGASWVIVEGFTLEGDGDPDTDRAGIRSVGFADDPACCNTFRHNRADRHGVWGIFTGFVADLTIEGNETSRSVDEHGIYVSNSADRPVVRGNLVWGNHANGIHLNGDASQGGDGVISGAVIEGNRIWGNGTGGGSAINGDGLESAVIRNNLVWDQHASGISLYRIDGGAPSTGNLVADNTVIVAADGRWALNIQDGSTGNTVRNNILWSDHPDRGAIDLCGACLPGFSSDFNALEDRLSLDEEWIDLEEWQGRTGQDGSSLTALPAALFLDPAGADYRLRSDSPAIDSGDVFGSPPADLLGIPRPQGGGFDIGAYESAASPLLLGPFPGLAGRANRFAAHGFTPGATVRLAGGLAPGSLAVPGCPGLELLIADPRLLDATLADAAGSGSLGVRVPQAGSGRTVRFQAVSPGTCELSGRVDHAFP